MNLKLYFLCNEGRLTKLKTRYLRVQYIQLPCYGTTNERSNYTSQCTDYSGVSIDFDHPFSLDQNHSWIKKIQKSID